MGQANIVCLLVWLTGKDTAVLWFTGEANQTWGHIGTHLPSLHHVWPVCRNFKVMKEK